MSRRCVRRELRAQSKGSGQVTLDGRKGLVRKLALEMRLYLQELEKGKNVSTIISTLVHITQALAMLGIFYASCIPHKTP